MSSDGNRTLADESTVSGSPTEIADTHTPAPASAPTSTPRRVSRYVVDGRLGEGGMGVVLAATDPDLDRDVAIKLIKTTQQTSGGQVRLLREAQAMAKLSHPNVVTVYDVGTHDQGIFVAMERIHGTTLAAWLHAERRAWNELWPVFRDAARGLEAAHASGIVHRDFKPANVLIDETAGRTLVTDFGLARSLDQPEADDSAPAKHTALSSTITRTGSIMGTPMYMSPEQHRGQPVDARSDQFSFCVALYEALWGVRPFEGKTGRELAAAVTSGDVREPPADAGVPPNVRRAVMRGLSVHPEDRFSSMTELIAALSPEPASSSRLWLAGAAFVAVTATAAFSLLVPGRGDERAQPAAATCDASGAKMRAAWNTTAKARLRASFERAKLPDTTFEATTAALDEYANKWITSRTDACLATRVHGEQSDTMMDRRMACLDERLAGMTKALQLMTDADPKRVARAAGVARKLSAIKACNDTAALSRSIGSIPAGKRAEASELRADMQQARVQLIAGDITGALKTQRDILRRANQYELPSIAAATQFRIGETYLFLSKMDDAERALKTAIKLAEAARNDTARANALLRLAYIAGFVRRKYDEGLNLLDLAEAAVKRIKSPGALARLYATRGFLLDAKGDSSGAVKAHSMAVEQTARHKGADHPDVASRLNNLIQVLLQVDKPKQALAAAQRAERILKRTYGPDHMRMATLAHSLGMVYEELHRYDDAIAAYKRGLRIFRAKQGENSRHTEAAYVQLGNVYGSLQRYELSVAYNKRALKVCTALRGKDHITCAMPIHNMGDALSSWGKYKQARVMLERALAIRLKVYPKDHVEVGLSHMALGALARRQGKLAEARRHYTAGLQIFTKQRGPEHSSVASALHSLALVELAAKRPKQAVELLERALPVARKTNTLVGEITADLAKARRQLAR